MFTINSFESTMGGNKGSLVSTVMLGDDPNPTKNRHIGQRLAREILAILADSSQISPFLESLKMVANQNAPITTGGIESPKKNRRKAKVSK